jgi:hypothetical protein
MILGGMRWHFVYLLSLVLAGFEVCVIMLLAIGA